MSLPGAIPEKIAIRIDTSAAELEDMIRRIDATTSVTEYRSLTTALNTSMAGDYYELEDNTTYLAFVLNNLSQGHAAT
jgi:hypothetical protein